jgi:hypothetical protein
MNRNSVSTNSRLRSLAIQTIAACLALSLNAFAWQAQQKKPISKKGLLEAVRLNGLSTSELIQRIRERGVSFQLTPADEAEFRQAGARPELIAAVRANYVSAGENNRIPELHTPISKPVVVSLPPGPPLSKSEIITLLQSGVASARVEQFVAARGVNFKISQKLAREITAAGGSPALLSLLSRNGAEVEPDYDDLTDQATAAIRSSDAATAARLLEQAIRLDPAQPGAYALLGFTRLYGLRDAISAEQAMRAAIERDGSAPFRVFHDHRSGFFTDLCQGSLFITKSGVTFRADDGNHTFEAADADLSEAKLNRAVGKNYGAFHLEVRQANGKEKNFNFAPLTANREESLLILALINSYQ